MASRRKEFKVILAKEVQVRNVEVKYNQAAKDAIELISRIKDYMITNPDSLDIPITLVKNAVDISSGELWEAFGQAYNRRAAARDKTLEVHET